MRKISIVIVLVFIELLGLQAQSLEKVLEKHFAATGTEKMTAVKTFYIKSTMTMMGMEIPMLIQTKQPNMFRVEVETMGQKITSAFDGKTGWMINPIMGSGVNDLGGKELEQAMTQADVRGELYNYKQKGSRAELMGKETVDGKEVYVIKLTKKDESIQKYFIDASNYLITQIKAEIKAMGKKLEVDTKILEYKELEGIKLAKQIEVTTLMGSQKVVLEEVKLNKPIDDSIFARPAN